MILKLSPPLLSLSIMCPAATDHKGNRKAHICNCYKGLSWYKTKLFPLYRRETILKLAITEELNSLLTHTPHFATETRTALMMKPSIHIIRLKKRLALINTVQEHNFIANITIGIYCKNKNCLWWW